MKIQLCKTGHAFVPADEAAEKLHRNLGAGETLLFEVIKCRSIQWHRMYFGICRDIGQNQDPARDESSIDNELRIRAGHFDVMYVGKDRLPWWFDALLAFLPDTDMGHWFAKRMRRAFELRMVLVPKRIAFNKLTAAEWAELWPSIELAIRERFGEEYVNTMRMAG